MLKHILPVVLMSSASVMPACAETLPEALARAYRDNPTLTAARAGQRATDETIAIAKADGRPSAALNAELGNNILRQELVPGITQTPLRSLTANGTLTVPIYSGGVVRNSIKAANRRSEAGRESLRGTEMSVFSNVVAAYLDVIRDSAIVQLNQENVSALDVNLRASRDRFEVGDVTRTDVAQSESRLSLAQANLETALSNLIGSKENYIALVGVAPDNLQSPPGLRGLPASPTTAVSIALTDNPDILGSRKSAEAFRYDTRAAEGQIAPRLSGFLRGSYLDYLATEQRLDPRVQPAASNRQATAGATLTLPLYQGGRPGSLARRSAQLESQAIEDSIATERGVIAQARAAFASWQASLKAVDSNRNAVASAAVALEGVRAESSVGTRQILDILNAQNELVNTKVQLVVAERNAYVAAFTVLASMGHAQAQDLGLDVGALYDPMAYNRRAHAAIFDMAFPDRPVQSAPGTTATAPQTSVTLLPPGPVTEAITPPSGSDIAPVPRMGGSAPATMPR